MNGIIVNYRSSRHRQKNNQAVISIEGISSREEAEKLVGKTVKFLCSGKNEKKIQGTISGAHGKKGAVRALFEKGLPGQAIGKQVLIE